MSMRDDPIWAIRASIARLEEAKDTIISSFGTGFPSVDAKEAYFGTVMAWEQLRAASGGRSGSLANSRWALEAAKSRALQCESALNGDVQKSFCEAFDVCYREISAALDALAPPQEARPPQRIVVKKSDDELGLLCSVCGALSWTITRRGGSLEYSGISSSMELRSDDAPAVFDLLARSDIAGTHEYLFQRYANGYDVMGIDAFCPQCAKIYCAQHYGASEQFDEGFYDCTYGTCPQGHRRVIND